MPSERVSHALSALCGATGLILLLVFVRRRAVRLVSEPLGITTTAAMLSLSSPPKKLELSPQTDLKNALENIWFILDKDGRVDMVEGS